MSLSTPSTMSLSKSSEASAQFKMQLYTGFVDSFRGTHQEYAGQDKYDNAGDSEFPAVEDLICLTVDGVKTDLKEQSYEDLSKLVLECSKTVLGEMHPDTLRTMDNTVAVLLEDNHPQNTDFQVRRRKVRRKLRSLKTPPKIPGHTLDDEEDFDREVQELLERRTERLLHQNPETYHRLKDFADIFVPLDDHFSAELAFGLVTFDCNTETSNCTQYVLFDPGSKANYIFRTTLSKLHPEAKITDNPPTKKEIRPRPTSKPYQTLGQTTLLWKFSAQEPFREAIFTVLDGPHDGIVFSFQVLLENYVFRNKYAGILDKKKVSTEKARSTDEGQQQPIFLWIMIGLLLAVIGFLSGLIACLLIVILLLLAFISKDFLVKENNAKQTKEDFRKQRNTSNNSLDPADLDAEFYDANGKPRRILVRLDNSNTSGAHLVDMDTVKSLNHEDTIDPSNTISLTGFSKKLTDQSLGEVQLTWRPVPAKKRINLSFHVLDDLEFEVILDAGWCRENKYLLYNPGAVAVIFRQKKRQTEEQVKAQEQKKRDLAERRKKEKEEKQRIQTLWSSFCPKTGLNTGPKI